MPSDMPSAYEDEFENIEDRTIVISDLIEQVLRVEELIQRYRDVDAEPAMYRQYEYLKQEFQDALNVELGKLNLMIVSKAA